MESIYYYIFSKSILIEESLLAVIKLATHLGSAGLYVNGYEFLNVVYLVEH